MDPLSQQAARGDREAMAQIVREHYGAVYRFCARRIGQELAKDAAQDTFVTAQKAIRKFDGRSSLGTWLFGIAHNHCRNLSRKQKAEVPIEDVWGREADDEPAAIDREILRKALGRLAKDQLDAVMLHEVEGLTYDEAAQVLGVPVGTVKSRLHHAFLKLREEIGSIEVKA